MSTDVQRRQLLLSISLPSGPRPVLRVAAVACTLGLAGLLWRHSETGLVVLWGVVVPLLPLWWYVAPGAWRNVCPMAAANQLPRALGISRSGSLPPWLRSQGYLIAIVLFLAVLTARKAGLDDDGRALAVLVVGLLLCAVVGGFLFAGKSGWCGSVCPLRPVQDLYARQPLLPSASACRPCVGCMTDCPDLGGHTWKAPSSRAGAATDIARRRALLAGLLPGLIAGFHTTGDSLAAVPAIGLSMLVSVGVVFVIESVGRVPLRVLGMLSAAVSLNLFYWFNAPLMAGAAAELLSFAVPDSLVWIIRENVLALTLVVAVRSMRRRSQQSEPTPALSPRIPVVRRESRAEPEAAASVTVTVLPADRRIQVAAGTSLAQALEEAGLAAAAGCGQGLCGNDPVFVLSGQASLSAPGEPERRTLARLDLPGNARLACSTRVEGDVAVSLTDGGAVNAVLSSTAAGAAGPPRRFVVVGGGIAGTTAVEELRRLSPDAEIDLVAGEDRPLYNRIALNDLLDAPKDFDRLHLRDQSWASDTGVRLWRGSSVAVLDRSHRAVVLEGGQRIPYDGLILATGAAAARLDVEGADLPGVHVLRSADDASAIGSQMAQNSIRRAVVVGGGLLGVETAVALHARGLAVTLLARGSRLVPGRLDNRASALLVASIRGLGVDVQLETGVRALYGVGRLQTVVRADGATLPADLLVACVGVTPNADVARAAGLEVGHGIVVDDGLRTSDPFIFAVGDVAEHDGQAGSLWATAERQALIAARNASGRNTTYVPSVDVTVLRLPGIDVVASGVRGKDAPVVCDDASTPAYRRLDITADRVTGMILLNDRRWTRVANEAVEAGLRIGEMRAALAAGDWSVLGDEASPCRRAVAGSPPAVHATRAVPSARSARAAAGRRAR